MSRAECRGRRLRRMLGASGALDTDGTCAMLGLRLTILELETADEIMSSAGIAVARRLEKPERRWATAHAIGHHDLHRGNQLWLREKTLLAIPVEQQAEDFAWGLLVNEVEAREMGLTTSWEIAEHFGIPEDMVRFQGRLEI